MYYVIDNGESYEDYYDIILYHRRRFSREEFLNLVQEAAKALKGISPYYPDYRTIAERLEELHNFKIVRPIMGVACHWERSPSLCHWTERS